ncbi:TonB-dependent receptor domain-containing protein [Noviherbaspirillum sedimenti]|uniref:TonB-dependent receptor n=1 Tax=Noviherbaspirillum sedimenti TaxID=2320865 RepID=A0A3A3GDN7_9BURK|nr:TonB-dependent receptor [Noviherbaspirillum sedimenti]RJG00346.1 TonB-dependent receptor [Noviherbaspirillum sedimenti]
MFISSDAPTLGFVGLLVAFSSPAFAQVPLLNEVVVTANRTEQAIGDVVADLTVIDRAEIERSGASAIADILSRSPGIQFYRNGGPGSTTTLMMRGADTRFTAVYIDGVRVDSQSTGGATWEAIPLSQIDRIEILRGPAAAIYGSDAIAGVIQVFTRQGEGAFAPYIGAGLGTHDTKKIDAGFSGSAGAFDYSLGLSKERSDGFNARQRANPDKDGYASHAANARLGFKINSAHRIEATILNSYMDSQYDTSPRLDDHSIRRLKTLGLSWNAKWSDVFGTRASISEGKDYYETYPVAYATETQVRNYLWQNELRHGVHLITAALERREDELQNSTTIPALTKRFQNALALGYVLGNPIHSLQLNARHDLDSEFGGKSTGSAAYAYSFLPGWRATASIGTAFRVPTLFQRFSVFGSSSLVPETSINREIGLKYAKQGSTFGVVAYKNKVDNLVTFISGAGACASATGCYTNTKHVQLEGVTISGATTINAIRFGASLDWLKPVDLDTGKDLIRRARRHATFTAETPLAGWQVGSELQLFSQRYDNAANTLRLGGYSLVNLYASHKLGKDYSVLFRVDNLADHTYQLANTYNTAGRTVFVGLRWSPK